MDLNTDQLTADRLEKILTLVKERDAVHAQLAGTEAQVAGLQAQAESLREKTRSLSEHIDQIAVGKEMSQGKSQRNGHPTRKKPFQPHRANQPKASGTPKGKGRSRKIGDTILEFLRLAGDQGASVKEICGRFQLKEDTVSKWLALHLKGSQGLTRPERGLYVLREAKEAPVKAETSGSPEVVVSGT